MPVFYDACPVCGKTYRNAEVSYRRWCSVSCEASQDKGRCEHGYAPSRCVKCREEKLDAGK